MFAASTKMKTLEDQLKSLATENEQLKIERDFLENELGSGEAARIVGRVRALEAEIAELRRSRQAAAEPVAGGEGGGVAANPREVVAKIGAFAAKISNLNTVVSSMEAELAALHQDRAILEEKIGASDADGILAHVDALEETIKSMEGQLMTLYSGRKQLENELGRSNPDDIVLMFRNISQMVSGITQELQPAA